MLVSGSMMAQEWQWAIQPTGTSYKMTLDVAADLDNYSYAVGSYENGSFTFGATTLASVPLNKSDGFLTKTDPAGTPVWAVRAGGTWEEAIKRVASNSTGSNIFVAGSHKNAITLYSINSVKRLLPARSTNGCFLGMYSSTGVLQWAISFGDPTLDYTVWDLTINEALNKVYLSGEASGKFFAVCYDYNTVLQDWSFQSTAGFSNAFGIAADVWGNSFVLASYTGPATTIAFPGAGAYTGDNGMLLIKLTPTGTVDWVNNIGGPTTGIEVGRGIALDTDRNIYIAGQYDGHANISGKTLYNSNVNTNDAFIAKYDRYGSIKWAKTFGGQGHQLVNGFGTTSSGDSYMFVYNGENSTVNMGCKTHTAIMGNSDNKMFVAKFDAFGIMKGSASPIVNDSQSSPNALCVGSGGTAFVGGRVSSPVAFGTTTLTGMQEAFIARVDIKDEAPTIQNDVHVCGLGTSAFLIPTGPSGAGYTFNWYNSVGTLLATAPAYSTPSASSFGSVIYYVTATNGTCVSDKVPVTVTTHSVNQLMASADQTICAGFCATVTFSNVSSAILSPGGTTVSSPFTICPSVTTIYTLSNAAPGFCQYPNTTKITVAPFIGSYDAHVYEQSPCAVTMSGNSKPACLTPGAIATTMPSDLDLAAFRCLLGTSPGWEGAGNAGITNFSISGSYTVEVYEADASGNRKVIGGTPAPPVFLKYGSNPLSTLALLFNNSGNGAGFDAGASPFFTDGTADGTGSIGTGDYFKDRYTKAYNNTAGNLAGEKLADYSNVVFCVDMKQTSPLGCIASKKSYFKIANNGASNGKGARMAVSGEESESLYTSLEIYPNPTNNMVYIPLNSDDRNVQVIITDNLGKQVMKTNNLETSHGELNMESLPPGIYFYNILKNNTAYKGKIVKQ